MVQQKKRQVWGRQAIGVTSHYCWTVLILFLFSWSASAGGPSIDRGKLVEQIRAYEQATRTNDLNSIVEAMPPRLVDAMAAVNNRTAEKFKARFIAVLKPLMAAVRVERIDMKEEAMTLSKPGAPVPYALLPTTIVMFLRKEGKRFRKETTFVAVMDGGTWYFDRVDGPGKFTTLAKLYPSLRGLGPMIKSASVKRLN